MATMYIYRGFPASGKSTAAREAVAKDPGNTIEINRDNTRHLIGVKGKLGTKEQEALVTTINSDILDITLKEKKNIIVSDTNLRVRYVKELARKALTSDYDVKIVDFKNISLEELIKRDQNRDDPAGETAIRTMWEKFPYSRWVSSDEILAEAKEGNEAAQRSANPYNNDPSLPHAILVDIDGTLANHHGVRNVYDYDKVLLDLPHDDIINIVRLEKESGTLIVIMSGREDRCKKDTITWLQRFGVPFDAVLMRSTGDRRPDSKIKEELIRKYVQDKYYVKYCLDDRNSVVEVNRARGYRVLQVAPGDF